MRHTTISGYIRTLTMMNVQAATPTMRCLAPTQSRRSMADDVIEVRAVYSQLQTTI